MNTLLSIFPAYSIFDGPPNIIQIAFGLALINFLLGYFISSRFLIYKQSFRINHALFGLGYGVITFFSMIPTSLLCTHLILTMSSNMTPITGYIYVIGLLIPPNLLFLWFFMQSRKLRKIAAPEKTKLSTSA